jgi:hypothetical protein
VSSLRRLSRDPSQRYTDAGWALLRRLELHACGPDQVRALIEMVPAHCGYLVADIARTCGQEWLGLAAELEQRFQDSR